MYHHTRLSSTHRSRAISVSAILIIHAYSLSFALFHPINLPSLSSTGDACPTQSNEVSWSHSTSPCIIGLCVPHVQPMDSSVGSSVSSSLSRVRHSDSQCTTPQSLILRISFSFSLSLSLSLSLVCKPHLRYTPLPPYFSSSSLTCEVDSLTVPFHWSYSFPHFILFFILPYLSFVFTSRPYTSDGLSHGVTYHIPCYSPFIIIRTRVLFPSPSSIFYLRPLCYISHHRVATPVFRLPVVLTSPA